MLRYNRARRAEWIEAQKKFEADELATARIAYLKGDATEEQILLVEEANREAEEKGIKLPSLLSPPEHRTHFEEHVKSAFEGGQGQGQAAEGQGKGKGILGYIWGGSDSKKSDASTTASSAVQSSWEQEKENQLNVPVLESGSSSTESKKKGWW